MCKACKTVLIVEDQVLIAMGEKIALENCGYKVLTANTGDTAVEMVKSLLPIDLILMDIDLGKGIDGLETAIRIMSNQNHDIPIVFLSNCTEMATIEKMRRIPSYGYIVKNSGIMILDASIRMAFKLFEARDFTGPRSCP
jgi:CheY-like chemotaxis protein